MQSWLVEMTRMIEYCDYVARLRRTHAALADELANVHALEKLLDWLRARAVNLATLDMVTQDEYSHDLVIPLGTEQWLVFGMT